MFNLQAWAEFTCPNCRARLEAKPPRSTPLVVPMACLFVLARQGHVFEVIAVAFAALTFVLFMLESAHPQLRAKKPLPQPHIRLNIAGDQQ